MAFIGSMPNERSPGNVTFGDGLRDVGVTTFEETTWRYTSHCRSYTIAYNTLSWRRNGLESKDVTLLSAERRTHLLLAWQPIGH